MGGITRLTALSYPSRLGIRQMPPDIDASLAALPGYPVLAGPRLQLRAPRDEDTAGVFALFSDPAVMRYWSSAPMQDPSQARARIEDMRAGFESRRTINWLLADAADRVIGSCTLFHFDARHRHAEVGYALLSSHWGRGLAAEAVALALDWGFDVLHLHRIEADIDPRNHASRRLLQRLGFRREGLLRERFFVEGVAMDSEVHGLLAAEWRGAPHRGDDGPGPTRAA